MVRRKDEPGLILLVGIFLLTGRVVFSQDLPAPVRDGISSDYGPRNVRDGRYFHQGIDYGCRPGTTINAVEGGTVSDFGYDRGGFGWRMYVEGTHGTWLYGHMFDDGANPRSGNFEVMIARRYDSLGNPTGQEAYCIVVWINRAEGIAGSALCERVGPRWYIPLGNGDFVRDRNGARLTTTNQTADTGNIIGPSGDSGAGDAHLHLGLNRGADNPLLYVRHPDSNFTITIHHPTANQIIYHTTPIDTERIWVNVNSANGLDLNRVDVYLNRPGEEIYDDNHRINTTRNAPPIRAEINYGGRENEGIFPASIENIRGSFNNRITGVDPQGDDPGNDDFIFCNFNSKINDTFSNDAVLNREAKYPDGRWIMRVRVLDIDAENRNPFDEDVEITLDNFLPYVQEVKIEQGGRRYCGRWPEEPLSEEKLAEELTVVEDDAFSAGELVFRIRFSEAMDGSVKPSGIYFETEKGKEVKLEFETWQTKRYENDTLILKAKIPEDDLAEYAGEAVLHIGGVKDLAGNELDGKPVPRRKELVGNAHPTGLG